jgi:flagellar motor switch protein FliN/FliY
MGDGSLTQEEIDLLLQGADNFSAEAKRSPESSGFDVLSAEERRFVSALLSHAMQSGVPAISSLLSREVKLGEPFLETRSCSELQSEYGQNHAICTQQLRGGLNGTIGLILTGADASKISGLMMGSAEATEGGAELDSAQIATFKDSVSPLMNSAITQLSVKIGTAIQTMPPEAFFSSPQSPFPVRTEDICLRVSFPLKIEKVLDSRLHVVMPVSVVRELIQKSQVGAQQGAPGGGQMGVGQPQNNLASMGIKEVQFPNLNIPALGAQSPNMNLLMDVQMTLTVELGRTKMYIKEILSLGEGSIIELDKLAGEPVDLLVNGKLIAKGEVVVIDENFGVRVTDIVSPVDRIRSQKKG